MRGIGGAGNGAGISLRMVSLAVMPGLDPGIHADGDALPPRWTLGSSPRVTTELAANGVCQRVVYSAW